MRIIFLTVLLASFLLLTSCSNQQVVFQFVDYNCKPIPNVAMMISDYDNNFLAGDSVSYSELKTDKNGFIVYSRKHDRAINIMQLKHWHVFGHSQGNGKFNRFLDSRGPRAYEELRLALNNSSKDKPLYIYPYETIPDNTHRQQSKLQNKFRIHPDKVTEHLISEYGDSSRTITKLHIKEMENDFLITLRSPKNTGLISIHHSALPLSGTLPIRGYNQQLIWRIPKNTLYPNKKQSIYYFKNHHRFGILTLEIAITKNQLLATEFIVNTFLDSAPAGAENKPPHLQQEICGGVAARHYEGYYGHIYHNQRLAKIIKQIPISQTRLTAINQQKILFKKARDIHTKDQWFINQQPNETLALAAVDNNAAIASRLAVLFHLHNIEANYARNRRHKYQRLMEHLAADPRTPADVITQLFRLNLAGDIQLNLLGNPATPQNIANKLAITLTKSIEVMQEHDLIRFYYLLEQKLFTNNAVSAATLNKVIKLSANNFSRSPSPYRDQRLTAKSLEYLYNRVKEKKGYLSSILPALKQSPKTPQSVLWDIYNRQLKNNHGSINQAQIVALLNHPHAPKEMFYQLFKSKKNWSILAQSTNTPIDIWKIIIKEEKDHFKPNTKMIARNAGTPNTLLKQLSKEYFRTVTENKQLTDKEFAAYFSNFQDDQIIKKHAFSLLRNPKTPVKVLLKIVNNGWVNHYAGLVKNNNTPPQILHSLYGESDRTNILISKHPNIDRALINKIINKEQKSSLIAGLAANPSTPVDILWRIIKGDYIVTDGYKRVSRHHLALYCNPATPEKLREQLPYRLHIQCQ